MFDQKVASKFEKHHLSRMPHPFYSPDMSSTDFWIFGMLKRILKQEHFKLSREIEEMRNDLTFTDGMSHLAWMIETREEEFRSNGELTSSG
jgi:hypothetical protein